jgi:tripartite-type tricarboxylate transporter receptor subunit TctC
VGGFIGIHTREAGVKILLGPGFVLGILLSASGALAAYPDRPVKIIVPFAPAGVTDIIARIVADKLSINLGQRYYVENRGGAGGNTGTAAVATAPPDGYTLLITGSGLVVNPSLFLNPGYDAVQDFAPISLIAVSPNVITVHPSVPAHSIRELIALIKANPGKYSYATAGHLTGEMFRTAHSLDLPAVRFRSAGPAILSTISGHTPIAITALAPATPQIKEGKLRGLMVTSEKRVRALPDVPTAAEAGLAGQENYTLTGMLAPAGTPKEIVDLIHAEIVKIVAMPDVHRRLDDLGFELIANSPDEFAARIKIELEWWAKVIRDAKIKPEGAQ